MGGGLAEENTHIVISFAAGVNRSFLSGDLLTHTQITGKERSLSQRDKSRCSTATSPATREHQGRPHRSGSCWLRPNIRSCCFVLLTDGCRRTNALRRLSHLESTCADLINSDTDCCVLNSFRANETTLKRFFFIRYSLIFVSKNCFQPKNLTLVFFPE